MKMLSLVLSSVALGYLTDLLRTEVHRFQWDFSVGSGGLGHLRLVAGEEAASRCVELW